MKKIGLMALLLMLFAAPAFAAWVYDSDVSNGGYNRDTSNNGYETDNYSYRGGSTRTKVLR